MTSTSTELTTIEGIQAPVAFRMNGLDEFIAKVKAEIQLTAPDISTNKGRDEIRSKAFKIARIKTAVDNLGKKAGEDARKMLDGVNAERKRAKDILEAFQEETRKPLTDWENADKERKEKLEAAIAKITATGSYASVHWQSLNLQEMRDGYDKILLDKTDWQEYEERGKAAIAQCIKDIEQAISKREKHDAEQAELARLRKEKEERDRLDREAQIAKEAADKAKREAEEKAQREADALAAKMKAEQEAAAKREADIKREKEEAEARAKKAEEERIAAEKKAELDRIAAEEKAERDRKEAEAKAEREKQAAIEAERERVAAEEKRQADEKAKREADQAHRKKINNAALEALLDVLKGDNLLTAAAAGKAVIEAIAKGKIPHVSIQY